MDTHTFYRKIVMDVINQYARLCPSHGQIRLDTVFDERQDRYALMQVGWDREVRVRGNLIYVILQGDQVLVEYDGIERGIVEDIVVRGIPQNNIHLAFLPTDVTSPVPA